MPVEQLNVATIFCQALDSDTLRWLAGIDKVLADKLAKVGLIPKREAATLGAFIDGYLLSRTDLKERTKVALRQVRKNLVEHFGERKRLADVHAGDADNFDCHCENLSGKTRCGGDAVGPSNCSMPHYGAS